MKNRCQSVLAMPTEWNLIVEGPFLGEENMRRDWQALDAQRNPEAIPGVRLYRWAEPTVTYGRLQPREPVEAFSLARGGRAVVQRPTGGGMVFHDSDISFSVVWRRDHPAIPPCVKNVYRLIHEALAIECRAQGMDVSLYPFPSPKRAEPGACYQDYSLDDILWKGQKVVGGALRVTSWGRLYQGNAKPSLSISQNNWEKILTKAFESHVFNHSPEKSSKCVRRFQGKHVGR